MRPGPGVDDGMVALPAQLRIVPAAPQVGPAEVVRGRGDPGRAQAAGGVRVADEVDRDGLPVGLVVVDAVERRAPVVEGVEVPVLQDGVAGRADDPRVGGAHGVGLAARVADHRRAEPVGRRDQAAGHPAADEQREPHQRVDQPGQHADRGEPRLAAQPRPVLPAPGRDLGPGELLLHEPQVERPPAVPQTRLGEPVRGQLAGRHEQLGARRRDPPSSAHRLHRARYASTEVGRKSSPAV